MSETKWTPGEWRQGMQSGANANCVYKQVGPGLHDVDAIAMVYGIPLNTSVGNVGERWAEGMANAALISAAPDLYAALMECSACVFFKEGGFSPRFERARAALAKARGEA